MFKNNCFKEMYQTYLNRRLINEMEKVEGNGLDSLKAVLIDSLTNLSSVLLSVFPL